MVSLTLWPVATLFSLVPVPFVVVYVTAGLIMEALFVGIPLRRSHGSGWTHPREILTTHRSAWASSAMV